MRHDGAQGLAHEMMRLLVSVFMAVASAHGGAPARRLRSKVSPAVASSARATTAAPTITEADKAKFVEAALGEEVALSEVGFLGEGVRTKHVHYTQGRSSDKTAGSGECRRSGSRSSSGGAHAPLAQQNVANRV